MSYEIQFNVAPGDELELLSRNREIAELLHEHVCEVTFTKVDGEKRVMPCTLKDGAMPQQAVNEFHKTRLFKPETISAFCIDKGEWRSFRVANVTEIRVIG